MKNQKLSVRANKELLGQAAALKGMSVSEYMRFVSEREAKDDIEEHEADLRVGARKREREHEAFFPREGTRSEPEPEAKDSGGTPITFEKFQEQVAKAHRWERIHVERRAAGPCTHVAPNVYCSIHGEVRRPPGSHGQITRWPTAD